MRLVGRVARNIVRRIGYGMVRHVAKPDSPLDFTESERHIVHEVSLFTMTSPESIVSLCRAVEYVVANDIPGAIVECGVWKGGSMMAAALTLERLGQTDRHIHLFDTFEGMTTPSEVDVSVVGKAASDLLKVSDRSARVWCCVPVESVRAALYRTGYDRSRIHFVQGPVEQTVPGNAPEQIALLRLDTDWYESTKHELTHLWPRLVSGGVLIVDDYGYWLGARQAVDEYIATNRLRILLSRIDYTGRIAVKP